MSAALWAVGALIVGALVGFVFGYYIGFDAGATSIKWLESVIRIHKEPK